MTCERCCTKAARFGKDRNGQQRWQCKTCKRTFGEIRENPLGNMRIGEGRAIMALQMLAEGCGLRTIERLTGLHRKTICKVLVRVGEQCDHYMQYRINNVPAREVECDELWTFVGMKQKTKNRKGIDDPLLGDQYCFVGIDRNTKLILAWHLGKRTKEDAEQFLDKLNWVTALGFQLSTDNWNGYHDTVHRALGDRVSHATIEKIYMQAPKDDARYSPPKVVGIIKKERQGHPDPNRICTSHVERQNLTIRHFIKRFARLSLCFSKKWEHLKAAIAWFFCYYNFGRIHGQGHKKSLRVTPAMEAGLTDHIWEIEEIIRTVSA